MRKHLLVAAALFCLFVNANAQISKGAIYFGGTLGYSKYTEDRTTPSPQAPVAGSQKATVINPAVGLALRQNLVAGISFSYGTSRQENYSNNGTYDYKVAGAGLFLRRYFPVATRFYVYGEASADYAHLLNTFESVSQAPSSNYKDETKGWRIDASLAPGIAYSLTRAFYIEMGLPNFFQVSYEKQTRTENTSGAGQAYITNRKGFSISSSLGTTSSLNVGVRFILPRK